MVWSKFLLVLFASPSISDQEIITICIYLFKLHAISLCHETFDLNAMSLNIVQSFEIIAPSHMTTYCSYCRRFIWRVSRVRRPGGQRRSCALAIRSSRRLPVRPLVDGEAPAGASCGHPVSARQRRIWACSSVLGVDIMPPHRVTWWR